MTSSLGFIISRVLAARRSPDLLAERVRSFEHANTEPWDRVLAPLVGIGGGLVPLIAALEGIGSVAPVGTVGLKIATLGVLLVGYALGSWALVENAFFSGTVRIQAERGHFVISTGPYRWVRHPGYVSAFLTFAATAWLLDGRWAWLAVAFVTIVLVIRTRLEDRVLQEKLVGYSTYARHVRFRLIPGIW